jgi:hypothetical protein
MRSTWCVAMALPIAAALAGCGATATSGGSLPPDSLAGKPAATLISMAQTYAQNAHYDFTGTASQTSTASGLAGIPAAYAAQVNSHGAWTYQGTVAGDKHISATADFSGVGVVHAIEIGCTGFASMDGTSWASGENERFLARFLAPSIDDSSKSGMKWTDLGATTVNGVAMHHLQATVTALSLSGGAPPAGATPPPGVSVAPTTEDIWLRSADGAVARMSGNIDLTENLTALRTPQHPDAAGTVHSIVANDATFTPSHTGVIPPTPTLTSDPVPAAVSAAFGPFGVQRDSCGQQTA